MFLLSFVQFIVRCISSVEISITLYENIDLQGVFEVLVYDFQKQTAIIFIYNKSVTKILDPPLKFRFNMYMYFKETLTEHTISGFTEQVTKKCFDFNVRLF